MHSIDIAQVQTQSCSVLQVITLTLPADFHHNSSLPSLYVVSYWKHWAVDKRNISLWLMGLMEWCGNGACVEQQKKCADMVSSLNNTGLVTVRWVLGWKWGCMLLALLFSFWQLRCFPKTTSASQQSTLCSSIPWAGFFFKELSVVLAIDFGLGWMVLKIPLWMYMAVLYYMAVKFFSSYTQRLKFTQSRTARITSLSSK